jgi:ribosomal protein S18 acetylase RimI-like enzyme
LESNGLESDGLESGGLESGGLASDELLGTAMVGHDGHRGWIYYLAVRADARARGHGRALVRACEHWVLGHGIPKLQLMVRSGNTAAVGFYERLGYTDTECVVLGRRLDETERLP